MIPSPDDGACTHERELPSEISTFTTEDNITAMLTQDAPTEVASLAQEAPPTQEALVQVRRASTDVDDPAYERRPGAREIGVGPMPEPWPEDPRLDRELLAFGDHRNVLDKYRYWSVEAIHADLATDRSALHIAIENLEHDLNIGSIVRSGNAFNVGGVHIVGRRRWNKRGAMVTDRYIDIHYHPTPESLAAWTHEHGYILVAVDNPPQSQPLEYAELPEKCLLVFGQESAGISPQLQAVCEQAVRIEQYGSTRSLNVAAAAAIAMHSWMVRHRPAPRSMAS